MSTEKIQNPTMKRFFEDGLAFIAKGSLTGKSPAFPVKFGTAEWAAWEQYFRDLRAEPYQMKMVRWKQMETMTMPAQWPQWFDSHWAAERVA